MNPAIKQALKFTNTYKEYKDAPIPIREAMCLKAQYPDLLKDIRDGDIYAGLGNRERIIYFGSVWWYSMPSYTPENQIAGKQGGYSFDFSAIHKLPQTDEERNVLADLTAFWKKECTTSKFYAKTDSRDGVGFLYANNLVRLVKRGLPGLVEDVTAMPDSDYKTGLHLALENVIDVFKYYQKQAEEKGRLDIAANLLANINHAPKTVAQGLQLILLYELLSHEMHFEVNRLDVALGDIYVQEIDSGALTEDQAVEQIRQFYSMINASGETAVCRLMMGGINRPNEVNADRFIMAALKAEQLHKQVIPQVSLRLYKGINPDLIKLAYDTINETNTFPTLYNDDNIIEGVAKTFDVSHDEAISYYPLGCGEYILAPKCPALLVAAWDVPKSLDKAIRNFKGNSYQELHQAVFKELQQQAEIYAKYHKLLIDTHNEQNTFLMASLLVDDCIKNGKPILDGGARYNGTCVMGQGFTNAAEGLLAIKKLVYESKQYTLEQVIKALDADFTGYEELQRALLTEPKYGNDNNEIDIAVNSLWRYMSDESKKAGKAVGLDFFTISSVNPGGYFMGFLMGATPDGRHKGMPYAIGNTPTAGMDKNGLTAL